MDAHVSEGPRLECNSSRRPAIATRARMHIHITDIQVPYFNAIPARYANSHCGIVIAEEGTALRILDQSVASAIDGDVVLCGRSNSRSPLRTGHDCTIFE